MTVAVKQTEMTMQPWAECEECDWGSEYSALTRDRVKSHVRATGHRVILIAEKHARWGPK